MIHDHKPPLDEALLIHFGVKGMKWGVRKNRPSSSSPTQSNDQSLVDISPSGAITLKKGAKLQRVVRRSDNVRFKAGEDLGTDLTYASFSDRDNSTYELMLGRKKSIFNKKASEVLTLSAKEDLKSPSPKEASSIFFKTLRDNPKARAEVESGLKEKSLLFSKDDVAKSIGDPTSQRAQDFYSYAYNKGNYKVGGSIANRAFTNNVQKSGYNMLLDIMDASTGQADQPVILLNPRKTVEITGRRVVDRESNRRASQVLKEAEKISNGRSFLESLNDRE